MARPPSNPQLNPSEVAFLVFAALQKEGCPPGGVEQLRGEIEAQLTATRHFLEHELRPKTPRTGPRRVGWSGRVAVDAARVHLVEQRQQVP